MGERLKGDRTRKGRGGKKWGIEQLKGGSIGSSSASDVYPPSKPGPVYLDMFHSNCWCKVRNLGRRFTHGKGSMLGEVSHSNPVAFMFSPVEFPLLPPLLLRGNSRRPEFNPLATKGNGAYAGFGGGR